MYNCSSVKSLAWLFHAVKSLDSCKRLMTFFLTARMSRNVFIWLRYFREIQPLNWRQWSVLEKVFQLQTSREPKQEIKHKRCIKKKCHIQLHKNKETYQLREGTLHECLDAIREFPKHIVIYKFKRWCIELIILVQIVRLCASKPFKTRHSSKTQICQMFKN